MPLLTPQPDTKKLHLGGIDIALLRFLSVRNPAQSPALQPGHRDTTVFYVRTEHSSFLRTSIPAPFNEDFYQKAEDIASHSW